MIQEVKIFQGSASKDIAAKIAENLELPLADLKLLRFSDGEFQPMIEETVRGCKVFAIQSTFPPADNIFELLLMADAAIRASAEQVIAVIPYFGWARQDRKDKPRVSIGSKMIADLLMASRISRVITMDLHADQIQGFFNIPVDHLYASAIFIPYLQSLGLTNMTMASPDTGGTRRANAYAKFLGTDFVICHKQRKEANVIETMQVIGDVDGRNIILLDDIVDTAGTLVRATEIMLEKGAKSVRALCTHPVLSGMAYENISKSNLVELVVTDTIPLKKQHPKIKVLSTADIFSEVIRKVIEHKSIAGHFIF
ncbi:MAG: ribose-phosphate pyrophosphokinase [Bacteroidetes bacterium]|nr:ribose-phosphate pyrophosphokinase [Bacteroidota bacterium]